jgi:hypothetical protein
MILATHDLTPTAKRGTLIYMTYNYEWKKVEGWFHLHGNTIVRRKIGGRNTYALCGSEMVMDFITYKKEAAQ